MGNQKLPTSERSRQPISRPLSKKNFETGTKYSQDEVLFVKRGIRRLPGHIFDENELERWVDRRTSWNHLGLHIFGGCAFIIVPYLLFRYALPIDVTCYELKNQNDAEASVTDCQDSIWAHRLMKFVSNTYNMTAIIMICHTVKPPRTEGTGIPNGIFAIIAFLYLAFIFTEDEGVRVVYLFLHVSIPVIYHRIKNAKDWHKPAATLFIFSGLKFFGSKELMVYLAPHLHKELILGLEVSFIVPLSITVTQGLTLLWVTRNARKFHFTPQNMDSAIYLAKWEANFFNTLKVITLFEVIRGGNYIGTLILTALLEILGRNQLWYVFFHKLKNWARGKKKPRRFPFLRKVFLWSEIDTDYFPLIIITLMNIFKSPLILVTEAKFHIQNRDLSLRPDSLVNHSALEIASLWAFIFLVDILSLFVNALIGEKRRVYAFRAIFMKSSAWACFSALVTFGTSVTVILTMTNLFNDA